MAGYSGCDWIPAFAGMMKVVEMTKVAGIIKVAGMTKVIGVSQSAGSL